MLGKMQQCQPVLAPTYHPAALHLELLDGDPVALEVSETVDISFQQLVPLHLSFQLGLQHPQLFLEGGREVGEREGKEGEREGRGGGEDGGEGRREFLEQ